MREIKFRGWSQRIKSMSSPVTIQEMAENGPMSFVFGEIVWLQYTGLRDCNGVDIYEGDIIRHTVYEMPYDETSPKTFRIGVVEYLAEDMAFSANNNPYVCDQEQGIESARMEVIGNIYEHPHLLESGE